MNLYKSAEALRKVMPENEVAGKKKNDKNLPAKPGKGCQL